MKAHVLGCVMLNGGDAAIMAGQMAMLDAHFPGVEVSISDTHPAAVGRYLPDWHVLPFVSATFHNPRWGGRRLKLRRALQRRYLLALASLSAQPRLRGLARLISPTVLRPVLARMSAADVILYTGGTSLVETYALDGKLLDLEFARRLRRPLVFLPMSAGPFEQTANRTRLQAIFAGSDAVVLRDERSRGHVLDLGDVPAAHCLVKPDIAFALARPHATWPPVRDAHDLRVAVSVRAWSHFDGLTPEEGTQRFVEALRATVTSLVTEHGATVVFVSTCQGRPEYWTDDSVFAQVIADGLDQMVLNKVTVDISARATDELIGELATYDLMISTRLHGAILATCTGVPVLPIAYEFKSREVWRQLGLEEWVVDIEDVDAVRLPKRVNDLIVARADIRRQLVQSVPPMTDGAMSVGLVLKDAMKAGLR